MRHSILFLVVGLWACEPEDPPKSGTGPQTGSPVVGTPAGTPVGTPAGTPVGTPSTGTPTGGTTPLVVDCNNLPNQPVVQRMNNARAYHGIAFDTADMLVGHDPNENLIQTDSLDNASLFVPNAGHFEQMAMLPSGDIVASEAWTGAIVRISPAGSITNIAQNINAYGVEVGPDGMIYTANYSGDIRRIDPATGASEVYIPGNGRSPKVMTWSPGYTKFYFGTLSDKVWVVDLDANYDPIGDPVVFASGLDTWHDGLEADVCGNLYLAEFWGSQLYKIAPDGTWTVLLDPPQNNYGHGIEWGPETGGWVSTAIYQPMPYDGNHVVEIDLGVPPRTWTGTVLNGP